MLLARLGCRRRSLSADLRFSLAIRARSNPASDRPFDLSDAFPRPLSARPIELSEDVPIPRSTPVPDGEAPLPPPAPRLLPWAAAVVALAVMKTIDTKIAPITKMILRLICLILLFLQSITATSEV